MPHPSIPFTIRCLTAAALCAVGVAQAQPGPEAMLGGPMRHDLLFMAGAQLDRERIVQGAPYCADAIHETVRVLADGNRITQRQTSRQCRDGQGRTRQEISTTGGRANVFLRDPVAHEAWMLDADRKLAVRLDAARIAADAGQPRAWDRLIGWGHGVGERILHTFRRAGPDATAESRPEPGPLPQLQPFEHVPMAGMSAPIMLHTRLIGPRGPGTTTLLPVETIDGLRADGKRTVWTIAAGRIGNEKPITITNEVWSSPELGITLRTRDVDPVVGEASFRVQNVTRGEPQPDLFKVPAEFAKVSPPAEMMRGKPQ
jgi:hypothetical protein